VNYKYELYMYSFEFIHEPEEFVRQFPVVRQCESVNSSVWQCAAVFLVVRVWQCMRQCAAVQQCGRVQECVANMMMIDDDDGAAEDDDDEQYGLWAIKSLLYVTTRSCQ
jgi:hypothetical protein